MKISNARYLRQAGGNKMEVAKITSRGQVTIPIDIRKKLGVKEGDKIIFIEDGNRI